MAEHGFGCAGEYYSVAIGCGVLGGFDAHSLGEGLDECSGPQLGRRESRRGRVAVVTGAEGPNNDNERAFARQGRERDRKRKAGEKAGRVS